MSKRLVEPQPISVPRVSKHRPARPVDMGTASSAPAKDSLSFPTDSQRPFDSPSLSPMLALKPRDRAQPPYQELSDKLASPAMRMIAEQGIAGPGAPLPYLSQLQSSFGKHDLGKVQAHTDSAGAGAAEKLGAEAYAYGSHVAFARPPSLFTAAHEAAHTVQQRWGLQQKDGVTQPGDAYEQHANAVAAQVVSGGSAESLLDQAPTRRGADLRGQVQGRVVQRRLKVGAKEWGKDEIGNFKADADYLNANWKAETWTQVETLIDAVSNYPFVNNAAFTNYITTYNTRVKARGQIGNASFDALETSAAQAGHKLTGAQRPRIKTQTDDLDQARKDFKTYGEVQQPNLEGELRNWLTAASLTLQHGAAETRLTDMLKTAQGTEAELAAVVESAVPTAENKTWVTGGELNLLTQAKADLAAPLAKQRENIAPLTTAAAVPVANNRPPTAHQAAELERANENYAATAAPVFNAKQVKDATEVVNKLKPAGIGKEIKLLLDTAHGDAAKNLYLDPNQTVNFVAANVAKSKPDVIAEVAAAVTSQHNVGVARWAKFLRMRPAQEGRLYLQDGIAHAQIDGYDVHASLFKDQLDKVVGVDVGTTPAATLKDQVLGKGVTGFHVTLEYGNYKVVYNPHAYRGLPNAVQNDFTQKPNKQSWLVVAPQLEKARTEAVAKAEAIIDDVKAKLGSHEGW